MNRNRMMLQMYNPPENENVSTDFAPAISVDFTTRIRENIETLQRILGVTNMEPMSAGSYIKIYKWKTVTLAQQVDEGEVIPLTKVERVLAKTIELVRNNLNADLNVEGVVMTMYDSRTKLAEQVVAEVRDSFESAVYKTMIPRTVRLSEAPSFGQPILYYDKKSKGADVYMKLAKAVISRG